RLFPENKQADSQTRREGIITQVLGLYESNDGNAIPEIKGTAYNLLNAVTEYADHFRGVRVTSGRQGMNEGAVRAENALFGTGDKLKSDAMVADLEEPEHMQTKETDIVKPSFGTSDKSFLQSLGIRG